jgi:cytochrome P450
MFFALFVISDLKDFYPEPETFIPERFDPENGGVKAFKARCVLIPFGDGPRICSGMRFAYMQVI